MFSLVRLTECYLSRKAYHKRKRQKLVNITKKHNELECLVLQIKLVILAETGIEGNLGFISMPDKKVLWCFCKCVANHPDLSQVTFSQVSPLEVS